MYTKQTYFVLVPVQALSLCVFHAFFMTQINAKTKAKGQTVQVQTNKTIQHWQAARQINSTGIISS